ncbi:MAG TPA: FUSC family protein [Solirubrobacteraceae bacterium]
MSAGGHGNPAARARERGTALLEHAVERSRPRIVADRLQANLGWLAQAALATAAAWVLAQQFFGHPRPIFAPVAALIGVSASPGQRRRSAVETLVGVALGIGIADALVVLIGTGPAQIAAVVCGAMAVAIGFGGSTVLIGEAAASALLVVTIQLPGSGLSAVRFLDSLLGGIVALAVTSLLPRNPVQAVHRAAAPLLAEIAGTLEDVARALERRDAELAERAWTRVYGLRLAELDGAVAAGREMLRLAPFRGGTREQFARYEQAAGQIRTALTSVETLSRGSVRAIDVGDNVPPPVPDAVRDLAETVRTLDEYLDDPAGRPVVREPALRAAAHATLVLEQTANLSVSVIVAQVRATAVDLIRGWGLAREEAERLVREAADRLATDEHAVPAQSSPEDP